MLSYNLFGLLTKDDCARTLDITLLLLFCIRVTYSSCLVGWITKCGRLEKELTPGIKVAPCGSGE